MLNLETSETLQDASATETFPAISGGVTAPKGFLAAACAVGVKAGIAASYENLPNKKDVALVVSTAPAHAAAVFTTNTVKAAPIRWCKQALQQETATRAIVVNSGNANACTGPMGEVHAQQMAETTARLLGCSPQAVLVASTGVIGVPLPIERIVSGIEQLAPMTSDTREAALAAAEAIMTTDTTVKETALSCLIGGKTVRIGAMAKGSGMIHPNMATMLAFITTDVDIAPDLLETAMKTSTRRSYNMISVDGDTSTNDMAVALANGLAGNPTIDSVDSEEFATFQAALDCVNTHMAQQIIRDGEGATKFLTVTVSGAETEALAATLARAIISSSLVKTAFFGEDANWGRILSAAGATGAAFDPSNVTIQLQSAAGTLILFDMGVPLAFQEAEAKTLLHEQDIHILMDLNRGSAVATAWGCDLSYDYVKINGDYRS